jgi:polyisoprenoid-binding protein YceI
MKPISRILMITIIVAFWSYAHSQTTYVTAGNQEIIIAGTSNVHDWEEKAETFGGAGMITWNADGSFNLSSLLVKIDCKAIKSSHGSIMDGKTYDALNADKFPTITYKLTTALMNITSSASGITINTVGQITIAGVTKPISMQVRVTANSGGQLLFEGTKAIKMSDFGVSPPTAFLGAMKVGDDVTLKFKASFSKGQANAQLN